VGPYRILESLADGAVTTLFRAEHERLGRVVLLKTLKKSLAEGSSVAAALDREAKILSRMAHSSIPRLLDVSNESPPTWLAFENLNGPLLSALFERTRRIDTTSAVAIALEIALGLAHIHARRVVHRNVESQGIVVSRDGRVILLDFGLAEDDKPAVKARFEPNQEAHGHRYTAPERIMGEPATPMSDVFAVGVVLYEMLCGQGPWDKGKPTPAELAHRIRSDEPTPFSAHGVSISSELSHVVLTCLAKRPDQRYEDGTALATALESALDALSTSPIPVLITRALAAADFGEALVEDNVRRRKKKAATERSVRPLVAQFAGLLALVVTGAVVIEGFMRETVGSRVSEEHIVDSERGFLRVLARPWAEIWVDGRLIDVTPMAKPIVVTIGRHYVTFKHPNAPDEQREIMVTAGQTVPLEVTMRVERRKVDAGVDADTAADASTDAAFSR
jgi:serine/threonine-protein kinase